jgi:ubiquinone/menaquinone biosynthesis C-methylase UbiE
MPESSLLRTDVPLLCPACRDARLDVSSTGACCPGCGVDYPADERGVLVLTKQVNEDERKQREIYDELTHGHAQTSDPWHAFISPHGLRYSRMLRKLRLTEGMRFLEVGCAAGPLTDSLASNTGAKGVGIDISPASIYAQLIRRGNRDSFDALVGSGTELPFPDETFDAVVSTDLLEHVDRPEQFHKEVARVTKPGGLILVRVNVMDFTFTLDWWKFKLTPKRWIEKMHSIGHFYENFRTKPQHAYLAREAGLEVVFIRGFDVFWDNLLEYHVLRGLAAMMKRGNGEASEPSKPPPEGIRLTVPNSLPHRVARLASRITEVALFPERIAGMLGMGASAWMLLRKK